jgi:hypothetical protein
MVSAKMASKKKASSRREENNYVWPMTAIRGGNVAANGVSGNNGDQCR